VPWSFCSAVPTYLAMGLAVHFLGPESPRLCCVLVLILFAIRVLGAGIVIPLWYDWQAILFSKGVRGRAIGMMAGASALGATLAATSAGALRSHLDFPLNYSLLFGISVAFFAVALTFFMAVREPPEMTDTSAVFRVRDLFIRFGQSLGDANFRNYLIGRILLTLGGGATAFYAVHFSSPDGGGLAESTVIGLGVFLFLPQAAGSYMLGRLGDRAGHRMGVILGAVAQAASLLLVYLGGGLWIGAACFALLGVAWGSGWVCHANMLFETCPHDSRVAHVTLSNLVLSPIVLLVPIATGWLVGSFVGLRNGIGLALVPTLLGVLWLIFVVKEPRTIEVSRQGLQASVSD
jgi:MFS family permease